MSGLLGFRYLHLYLEEHVGGCKADTCDEFTDNMNHQRRVQEDEKVIWDEITMILKEETNITGIAVARVLWG